MNRWLLLRRSMRAQRPALTLVGALVALTCLVVVGGGAWLHTSATQVFHRMLDNAPPQATRLTLRFTGHLTPHSATPAFGRHIVGSLDPVLNAMVKGPRVAAWSPQLDPDLLLHSDSLQRRLTLASLPHEQALVNWAVGHPPRPGVHNVDLPPNLAEAFGAPTADVIDIGLSRASARALRMPVGTYALGPAVYALPAAASGVLLHVSGVYTPAAPEPSRLDDVALLRKPNVSPDGTQVQASALVATTRTVLNIRWAIPPTVQWILAGGGRIPADRVADLQHSVARLSSGGAADLVSGRALHVEVVTGLGDLAGDFLPNRRASNALISVPATMVILAALLTVALAAGVLAWRRRIPTRLLRARGTGLMQLCSLRGLEAVVLVLPAVAVAIGAAAALRRAAPTGSDVVLACLTGLACALLLTAVAVTPEATSRTSRIRRPAVRMAVEVLVVVLAVVGAVVLFRRGHLQAGDPFLAGVPALVAVAATVVATGWLPWLLWRVRRIATRGKGVASLIAASGAAGAARTAVVPALVVALAAATAVLSLSVTATIPRGVQRAAWEHVGADVAVHGYSFSPKTVHRVADLPSVHTVTAVWQHRGVSAEGAGSVGSVTLLAVDPATFSAVQTPGPVQIPTPAPHTSGSGVTAVAAPAVAPLDATFTITYQTSHIPIRVIDRAEIAPGLSSGGSYALVDLDALRRATGSHLTPNVLLIRGTPHRAALRHALGNDGLLADITTLSGEVSRLSGQPAAWRTTTAFWVATGICGGLAVAGVILATAIGSYRRRRTASTLRTLGATRRQTSLLSAVDVIPTVLLAPLVGGVTGRFLAWLVDPGLNLRPLAGGPTVLHLAPDWVGLAIAAGCGAVVACLTVVGITLAAARRTVRPVSELVVLEER